MNVLVATVGSGQTQTIDIFLGEAVEKLLFQPQGRLSCEAEGTHKKTFSDLLLLFKLLYFVVFRKETVSIFIVAALLGQKHCAA